VDLDDPWLADVGFGDSFAEPLRLQPDLEQRQDGGTFRISQATQPLALERRQADDSWRLEYSFTLTPRQIGEFADRCHFHQTSPESSFTQKAHLLPAHSGWPHHAFRVESDRHES